MKKLFQLASLLLYFFVIFVFFFAGVYFAILTKAAEGQGLAGGAIVLGYGVISACIALLFSLVVAYHASEEVVVKLNKVLGVIFLIFVTITAYRIVIREGSQNATGSNSQISKEVPQPTNPSTDIPKSNE